jgi:hypothetical protein
MSEAEQTIQEDTGMTSQEKFLGIKSQIGTKPDEDVEGQEELDIEIVDDIPKEDKRVKPQKDKTNYASVDKEIASVGKRAKQRIDKLKYDFHQERRKKEQSAKLRDEAITYAQRVKSENDRLNQLVSDGQQYLGRQAEERAAFATQAAQQKYKEAYEQGNTDEMVKAQEAMTRATMDSASAEQYSDAAVYDAQMAEQQYAQQQYAQQQQQRQRPQVPTPDEEAVAWQAKNQWFGSDPEMTSFAYGIHEKLVRQENIDPKSEDYYTRIDTRMKEVFPDYFGMEKGRPPTTTSRSSVVAPATRNNSARPRKVQLTATQVSLAKRLGLTPQQYANQLIKDMSNV